MKTRRFMAAAVLAALPLVVGTLHARPAGVSAPAYEAAGHTGPQWLLALGKNRDDNSWPWAYCDAIGCGWWPFNIAL